MMFVISSIISPIVIFLAMASGLCLSSGLKFFVIGFGIARKSKIHYYFAIMSILFSLYFLNIIFLYESIFTNSVNDFIFISKFGLLLFYLALVSQLLFIKEYVEAKINFLVKVVFGVYMLIALSNLFLPLTWMYTDVSISNGSISLNPSLFYLIESVSTVFLYIFLAGYDTYNYYKLGKKEPAVVLGLAESIFLVSLIGDAILINTTTFPFYFFVQFGLVFFVFIVSLYQGYSIRMSEKLFERTANLVSQITKQTGEGITVANPDGRYIYTNQAYCQMTGYSEEEILKMKIFDFLSPNTKAQLFYKVQENKTGVRETELVKKDGSTFLAEISRYPFFINNNNAVLGVVRDITMKKKLDVRREQNSKMEAIGRLTGGIAHDFNNILAGIIGYSQISLMTINEDKELSESDDLTSSLNSIIKASERGKTLINQLLQYSKDNLEEDKKSVLLSSIVSDAMNFMKASLPSTIKISTIYNDKKPVLIDISRANDIIINLVTNASDAVKNNGQITVSVTEEIIKSSIIAKFGKVDPGEYVVLTVEDNGLGIPDSHFNRIFEPFFTTKPAGKGTGMGLTVVYGFVKNNNGEILVESTENVGSTFKVYFPTTDMITEEKKEKMIDEIKKGTESILLIDDEEAIIDSFSKILTKLNYNVHAFNNPLKALNHIKGAQHHFDLIITDQTMPDMSGFDLSKELLKIYPKIPIILITGYSTTETDIDILESGIMKILKKPVDIENLLVEIRKILEPDKIIDEFNN